MSEARTAPASGADDGAPLQPFRLLYPIGAERCTCRTEPKKRAALLGLFNDGQTILARAKERHGASWLEVTLPDGTIGWCRQHNESHMIRHRNTRTRYG